MSKERLSSLDIAKGLGILLVVFGHTISPVMEGNSFIEWIYRVIYIFHMPLFFFVSGYVATKLVTKPYPKATLLKERTIRLVIPYLTWAVIYLPMKVIMSEHVRFSSEYKWYSFFLGNNPDGQLWFLYVLFVISVFIILFVNQKNLTFFTIVFVIASFVAPLIPYSIGFTSITLSFSLYQVGFFFVGTLVGLKYDFKKATSNLLVFIVSLFVLVAYSIILFIKKNELWFLQAITAFCCIYICMYLSNILDKTIVQKPLAFLGKKSMEIYVLHGPLLVAGRIILPKFISCTELYILVLSISSIVASILISILINKIKIGRLLLFGSK